MRATNRSWLHGFGTFGCFPRLYRPCMRKLQHLAEGYALGSTAQFVRCLKIALGSATELLTHLTLLQSLNLVPEHDLQQCIELCDRVVSMIIGLIRKLTDR